MKILLILINYQFFITDEIPDFIRYNSSPNSLIPKYDKHEEKTDKEVRHDRCLSAILCSGSLLIMILISMTIALLLRRVIGYFTADTYYRQNFPEVPTENIDE